MEMFQECVAERARRREAGLPAEPPARWVAARVAAARKRGRRIYSGADAAIPRGDRDEQEEDYDGRDN